MISADREKVELYISCRKLKDLDVFSKSDPQVRCYLKDNGQWKLFSTTETQKDNLNPNFTTTFIVDFIFEVQQHIKFEVVDIDSATTFEHLGHVETTIGAIMGAKNQTSILSLNLNDKKIQSKLIIRGEKSGTARNQIFWQFSGDKLMNTGGLFGKSNPFLRFFKIRAGGDRLQVHESEVIMNNLHPIWKGFEILDAKLCSDHNSNFRIECWGWKKNGKHQYIGDCEVTLAQIRAGKTELQLHNPKKKNPTGTLRISNLSIQEKYSFIDYLRGGTQLNAVVAIDFTGSNGDPRNPTSLHAIQTNGKLNEYQRAINSVCEIVLNYDFDQQVPVYGFGGKPHYPALNSMTVSHCFPCSGDMQRQEVLGLKGVMDVYSYALQNVALSGPTLFAPLIREASAVCQANKLSENEAYTILLILTDGEIHDMDDSIDAIINASGLPLSIIIVGVGNADFSKMETLDGDNGLYGSKGQKCPRDLVQFVPFREFNGDMYLLAQHLLYEVPEQLVQYMKSINKKPSPAHMVDVNQLGFSMTLPTEPDQPPQGPTQSTMVTHGSAPHIEMNPTLMEQLHITTSPKVNIQTFFGNQNPAPGYNPGQGNPY